MVDCETPSPTLLCKENDSCLNELYHHKDEILELCSVSESDFEYIETLILRETNFQSDGDCSSLKNESSWWRSARVDIIKWIFYTRALFGFHYRTAYLSLIYFDRFFSRKLIDDGKLWAIRLLSVACLSLAAKMEETEVPALSEYHVDEYNFEGGTIQRMELLILNTLEWKMTSGTPFAYLKYFTTKFCGKFGHKELITRAVDLILEVLDEIKVNEHRPSIIAAAAVLAAYDYQLTEKIMELKMDAIPSWGSIEKEHTYSCYSRLQQIVMLKSKTPKSVVSPYLVSTHSRSIDVLDDSTITSAVGTKRRLNFCVSDQHCSPPKTRKS